MVEDQPKQISFRTAGNMLTLARLILLPIIVAGIPLKMGWITVGGMAAALVTDLLDGRVARRLKQASAFGRTLDSTIDFVLIYSLFIAFFAAGRLAVHEFAVIYLAMLTNLMLQIRAMSTAAEEGIVRTKLGKLTGALQYLYLLFLVAREVLPKTAAVAIIDLAIFTALAAAVVISSTEAILKIRGIK